MWLLTTLSRIPLQGLYLFSDFLFFIAYYVLGYRKDVIITNLKNSFPEMTDIERKAILKKFYRNLCDYAVETIKLPALSETEVKSRMVYRNAEILQPFADKKQSVILLASHQFNWEWLLLAGSVSLPMPVDYVYQEQNSDVFNSFLMKGRSHFGAYPIKRENVARESLRRKEIVRGVAIVADQYPGQGQNKRYWTKFLNQDTAFFQGLGQLAVLTQYPAFFAAVKKIKRGYYEIALVPVSQPPYEKDSYVMIDNYAKATEKMIRENPDGWLWSHKRWKDRS